MDRAQIPVDQDAARAAFDRLWKLIPARNSLTGLGRAARKRNKYRMRLRAKVRAIRWLAEQLGIAAEACRIESLDASQCARAVELCSHMDAEKVRAWSKARGL